MIVGIELINDDEYDIYFFDEFNIFLLFVLNNVCDYLEIVLINFFKNKLKKLI